MALSDSPDAASGVTAGMTTPTRDDWLWVAGFFDGEGGITLEGPYHPLLVGIGQRDEPIIREIHRLFGGHFQTDTTPEGRPIWHVRWHNDAKPFLEGILPFVRVKATEVRFALDWIQVDERFPRVSGRRGRMMALHRRWREEMCQRLTEYREDKSQPLSILSPNEGLRNPLPGMA